MPVAYAYLRVSHADQAANGNSVDTQRNVVESRFARLKEEEPDFEWGGAIEDLAQSAYSKGFFQRPGGAKLNGLLKKGDIVIFSRVDRAFRNQMDMWKTVEHWKARGARFIFCDIPFEPGTPFGDAFLSLLGTFAQLDSAMKSERIKAGNETRRAKGIPVGRMPRGFRREWSHALRRKVQVMLPTTEKVGNKIIELRESGLGFHRIADEIEDFVARMDRRESRRGIRSRYEFSVDTCEGLYRRFREKQDQ